ncbi:hypothetical protein IQ235_17005 [Oscillatoriales cyanobacterium LEGE 11467]|uniref:Uncharacterized protein n=1 Tax=Zarconia navalis LEGE 11467 TaxID=1828826 RepID=A0A928ZA94_9CYAN|nr:hypothetical protein [Zarconia navalis]MBE9042473.1 hypothetical protein [Zarconia navalis LEGE 11467]
MSFSFGLGDTFVVSNGGLFIGFGGVNPPSAATVVNGTIVPPVIPNSFSGAELTVSGTSGSLSFGGSADPIDSPGRASGNRGQSFEVSAFSGVASADDRLNPQTLEMPISDSEVMQVSIEPVFEEIVENDEAGNPISTGQRLVGDRFTTHETLPTPSASLQLSPNFLSNLLTQIFSGIGRS